MTDMTVDIFATERFGQVALRKLAPVSETFRLFSAGWLGTKPKDWKTMRVTGADFRVAKSGPNKGQLSIMVKGTQRSAYVTKEELKAQDAIETTAQDAKNQS
jgi:hypothetical protein